MFTSFHYKMSNIEHIIILSVFAFVINVVTAQRDAAADQLLEFKESHPEFNYITRSTGALVDSQSTILTAGLNGPALLQDISLLETISHFARERTTPRVLHERGSGAFGYFQVTHNISRYTKATVFAVNGKRTDVAVRFSTTAGEAGSAETVRDILGYAVKFQTENGVFDLLTVNAPAFAIRDPLLFPSMIHSQKRNPVTNLKDADAFWDFVTLRPETTNTILFLHTDHGLPAGYQNINGNSMNTFKCVNAEGVTVYCRFRFNSTQGLKTLSTEEAARLAGTDPDYFTRKLYNAIHEGDFPSWTLVAQVMTAEEAESFPFNPLDTTKFWPENDFPLIPVGTLVLNKNPNNYFEDVEQIAFSPANLIPGIEPTADKMLQARLFIYGDAQRYRLGVNFNQLPVNRPHRVKVKNYQRAGLFQNNTGSGSPNYFPNSFNGPIEMPEVKFSTYSVCGDIGRYPDINDDYDYYAQPTAQWQALDERHKRRVVKNIVHTLKHASKFIQVRAVRNFSKVSRQFGHMLIGALADAVAATSVSQKN